MTKPKFGDRVRDRAHREVARFSGWPNCAYGAGARRAWRLDASPQNGGAMDGWTSLTFTSLVSRVSPKEEWFDVVNERDEVIRRATRREVHANNWWHRAVHVLVFDAAGRVFLQRRSMKKDLSPGKWDSSCSGHLDSGEDYDAAAVRELYEEIGIRASTPPERWFRIDACEPTTWEFVWVYRLRHDGPLKLDPEEIQYGEWVAPEEVSRRVRERPDDFCPSFQLLWPMVAQRLASGNAAR